MHDEREAMTHKINSRSVVPATPAEAAVAAATWERRGVLARLTRIDGEAAPAEEPLRAARTRRPEVARAARSF